jgi:hypothetical protein
LLNFKNTFAIACQALASDPKKFAVLCLKLAVTNPIFIFQAICCLWSPTGLNLMMVPIAAITGHMVLNRTTLRDLARKLDGVRVEMLDEGLHGYSIPASQAIAVASGNNDATADVEHWLFRLGGMTGGTLDDLVRVHVAPGQCTPAIYCHAQFFRSHVFIGGFPKDHEPAQRLQLLHELFHPIAEMMVTPIWISELRTIAFVFVLWCGIVTYSMSTLLLLGAAVLCLIFLWHRSETRSVTMKSANAEVFADGLALGYLRALDASKLLERQFHAGSDGKLTDAGNAFRNAMLDRHLALASQGRSDEIIDRLGSLMPTPKVWLLVLTTVVVVAPTLGAPSIDWWRAAMCGCVFAIVALRFLLSGVQYGLSLQQIDERLNALFPMRESPTFGEPR